MELLQLVRSKTVNHRKVAEAVLASRIGSKTGEVLGGVKGARLGDVAQCVVSCGAVSFLDDGIGRELDRRLEAEVVRGWRGHSASITSDVLSAYCKARLKPKRFLSKLSTSLGRSLPPLEPTKIRHMLRIYASCRVLGISPGFLYNLKHGLSTHPSLTARNPSMLYHILERSAPPPRDANDEALFKSAFRILFREVFMQGKAKPADVIKILNALTVVGDVVDGEPLSGVRTTLLQWVDERSESLTAGEAAEFVRISGRLRYSPSDDRIINRIIKEYSGLRPGEVAGVVQGIAKMRVAISKTRREGFYNEIAKKVHQDDSFMVNAEAVDLVTVLWSFAATKFVSKTVTKGIVEHLSSPTLLSRLSPRGIASVLWSATQLPSSQTKQIVALLEATASAHSLLKATDHKTAARISWAVVKLRLPGQYLNRLVTERGFDFIQQAATSDEAIILWAAVHSGVRIPPQVLSHCGKRLLWEKDIDSVPKVLWVFSKVRFKEGNTSHLLGELYGKAVDEGNKAVTVQHVAMVARALTSVDVIRNMFYHKILPYMVKEAQVQQLDLATVTTLLWAFSKQRRNTDASVLLPSLDPHIHRAIPSTTVAQATGIINALARLSHPGRCANFAVYHVTPMIPQIPASHHYHLLESVRTLRCATGYEAALKGYLDSDAAALGEHRAKVEEALRDR